MDDEGVRNLVCAILIKAVEDLEVTATNKTYKDVTATNKTCRDSAVRFFGSSWGRSLMAYMDILYMPEELSEKIALASKA